MGNICRSPAAECLMRELVAQAGLSDRITCDSAGTIGFHAGSPPDHRMTSAARNRGYHLTGKARHFSHPDFPAHDLILTMDQENYPDVTRMAASPALAAKVIPLVAFSRKSPPPALVPDPYHGGPEGFNRVLDILEDCCAGLLDSLRDAMTKA